MRNTFDAARTLLNAAPGVSVGALSAPQLTTPVGADAGPEFLNAAARLDTELPPLELLDLLQEVENRLGRVRTLHWGPRTLDLDLLLYGDEIIDTPRLRVPHPHLWYRRFVLDPLAEIAADVVHPAKGLTIGQLRERLLKHPLKCALTGGTAGLRQSLVRELSPEFAQVRLDGELGQADSAPLGFEERDEPTLVVWLGGMEALQVEGAAQSTFLNADFESLPLVPRLDLSIVGTAPADALRSVLRAALGN